MAFVPIGTTDGSDWHGKMREVFFAAGTPTTDDVFLGDMVNLSGTGSADGRAEAVVETTFVTDTPVIGAVVEFTPDFTDEGSLIRNYHQGEDDQRGKVCYGSEVIYEAPTITALAITDIGANRLIAQGAGGSTVTGVSTHGIGAAGTAATDPLRIIGASQIEDDSGVAITAVGAVWRCRINLGADNTLAGV